MSAADGATAIDLRDVAKTYRGRVQALRGIAMRVQRGEIFGLLGPNGAGKSTLVKILMTVIRPTRCTGTMLDEPIGSRSVLQRVGYLPEHVRFPGYLSGGQVLDYFAALAKVPRHVRRPRAEELLEVVGLTDWRNKKVRTYSKGMRQRLGIAQALMNDPELAVLDEPTEGLDPVGRRDIRNVLLQLKSRGKTVFINSHLLSELEMICDRVAILSHGRLVRQGTIEELTGESRRYEIELASPLPEDEELKDVLRSLKGATLPSNTRPRITVPSDDAAAIQPVIDALRRAGAVIESIRPVRQSLEDYFIDVIADVPDGIAGKPQGAREHSDEPGTR